MADEKVVYLSCYYHTKFQIWSISHSGDITRGPTRPPSSLEIFKKAQLNPVGTETSWGRPRDVSFGRGDVSFGLNWTKMDVQRGRQRDIVGPSFTRRRPKDVQGKSKVGLRNSNLSLDKWNNNNNIRNVNAIFH